MRRLFAEGKGQRYLTEYTQRKKNSQWAANRQLAKQRITPIMISVTARPKTGRTHPSHLFPLAGEPAMALGERCLLVHGHFYQPPRENPWTGQIDPQPSAAPWENWNLRIADECYLPMARSRVYDHEGKIGDLYNNYAHTSFNFGPTLLSWVERTHPELLRHLQDATIIDRTFAMAQAYSHLILPLADARDRHTQIIWGLREFQHRFGFTPPGMWLSECGIDPETVRALIDHHVKYVILSPHQASRARPFGSFDWHDVSMGAIDTRRAYRLFDLDGGGRTHFDRYLDVVFYTPGLNLKVSFDHILSRPDDLKRELDNCYRKDSPEAQLVSIVTDGEIYGHHEKKGEEALSRLFRDLAPALGLKVVSPYEFIRDHPPAWEVKLWNGGDFCGSSWSCQHGVGRWFRDCGCKPPCPPGWNQAWRTPLREALDAVRERVRAVTGRELSRLVYDADDALNDYIAIVLKPSLDERRNFVKRHARKELSLQDVEQLWMLLEARHNAILMYTSCGWFFDELSGLEPVQNLRYALRASELIQPWHDEDLTALLEESLARAKSNLEQWGDGGKVFRELVLPSRHSNREIAAAMALSLAAEFPDDSLAWRIVEKTETTRYTDTDGNRILWGAFVCHDPRLDRFIKAAWYIRLEDFENTAVILNGYVEEQGDPLRDVACPLKPDGDFGWLHQIRGRIKNAPSAQMADIISAVGAVLPNRFPVAIRAALYRSFSSADEERLLRDSAQHGKSAVPFLANARRNGIPVAEEIEQDVRRAFEGEMTDQVMAAIAAMDFGDDALAKVKKARESAWQLGLGPRQDSIRNSLFLTAMELQHWLVRLSGKGWLETLQPLGRLTGGVNAEDGWLAPTAPVNRHLRYPEADRLAMALGRGLWKLRRRLAAAEEPARTALATVPLPELLAYMDGLGIAPRHEVGLGIAYWEFLDKPLARLIKPDGPEVLLGAAGERVRKVGDLLGFSAGTVEKRMPGRSGEPGAV